MIHTSNFVWIVGLSFCKKLGSKKALNMMYFGLNKVRNESGVYPKSSKPNLLKICSGACASSFGTHVIA